MVGVAGLASALGAATVIGAAAVGARHPLHTTLTQVAVDSAHHTVRATIRLFADDLAIVLSARASTSTTDLSTRATAYVSSLFSLSAAGQQLRLSSCGVRRTGDLLWVCLESPRSPSVAHLRARDPLLTEAFADQVNIVQLGDGPGRPSVIFLKGDRDKPLGD
jgi:hypothetical protein